MRSIDRRSFGLTRFLGAAPARLTALTLLFSAALWLAACGEDGGDPTPQVLPATPTTTPATSPSPSPVPTGTGSAGLERVQEIDFTDPALMGEVIDHFAGGEITPERITYTDLTGDGADEAVVIVESGGTLGDLGVAIFEVSGGDPQVLQYIEQGGKIEIRFADAGLGVIVGLEAAYAAGDPQCCPSQLEETVYQWDGDEFGVITEQVIDNPAAQ